MMVRVSIPIATLVSFAFSEMFTHAGEWSLGKCIGDAAALGYTGD
jgi:hypothetical protein